MWPATVDSAGMPTKECQVCSIKASCPSDSMYLFAPTPILAQRIESVLLETEVPFALHDRVFALQSRSDRAGLLNILESKLSAPEAHDLRVTFDLTNLMSATSLTQASHRAETKWFEDGLVHDLFEHWFQPIVDARQKSLVGHECLIRLARADSKSPFYNGQEIIEAAVSRGDLHVFDSYSRGAAIRAASRQDKRARVFINFTPSSIYDPAFCMASTLRAMEGTHLRPADIVFEVVESETVSNPVHLRKITDYYRDKGFGVALDDVGTGSNSLQMIADIQPDFIKLDKSIVWKWDSTIGLRMIRKLAELGAESNISVIAEGVEHAAMRDTLLDAGISLMQGYFFGKAAPRMADPFAPAAL